MSDAPAQANIERAGGFRWTWLIPLAALFFAGYLYMTHVRSRGPVITIEMSHGHGIRVGSTLHCRGIVVGEIERLTLTDDLRGVTARARLDPASKGLAREGTRFWIVRPRASLTGVGGLETIAGPQYISVSPGDGAPRDTFRVLDAPPIVEFVDPAGLMLTLTTDRRGSLRAGAPITYRQVEVGDVFSVELADDASQVRVQAYIRPAYAHLVRQDTVFWNVSGSSIHLGLTGLRWQVESMQALLDGGIALATPDPPGPRAVSGSTFTLHNESRDKWLEWTPKLSP